MDRLIDEVFIGSKKRPVVCCKGDGTVEDCQRCCYVNVADGTCSIRACMNQRVYFKIVTTPREGLIYRDAHGTFFMLREGAHLGHNCGCHGEDTSCRSIDQRLFGRVLQNWYWQRHDPVTLVSATESTISCVQTTLNPRKFWMVYVEGGNNPAYRHDTEEEATKEAERLAKKMDAPTYVLECVNCLVKQPSQFAWQKPKTSK